MVSGNFLVILAEFAVALLLRYWLFMYFGFQERKTARKKGSLQDIE